MKGVSFCFLIFWFFKISYSPLVIAGPENSFIEKKLRKKLEEDINLYT